MSGPRTMFAMVVTQSDNAMLYDIRGIVPTLEEGKQLFEREWRQSAKGPYPWSDEFRGAIANRYGALVYEVRPVEVRGLADVSTHTNTLVALRDARAEQLRHGHDWDAADVMQVLVDLGLVATR